MDGPEGFYVDDSGDEGADLELVEEAMERIRSIRQPPEYNFKVVCHYFLHLVVVGYDIDEDYVGHPLRSVRRSLDVQRHSILGSLWDQETREKLETYPIWVVSGQM